MNENAIRKGIVFGILLVFLGASVLPICNAGMNTPITPVMNEKVYKSNKNTIPSQFSHESEKEYVTATVEKSYNEKTKSTSGVLNNGDILDQQQTISDGGSVLSGVYYWAQGFKQTLGTLTRVELLFSKWGPSEHDNIRVYIRHSLRGSNLASGIIAPHQVQTGTLNWIEVDFEDIVVTPGDTYYIVCETTGGYPNEDYAYHWAGSDDDTYPFGDKWLLYTEGGSWEKWDPPKDQCFKTYGILSLEITRVMGGFGVSAILTNNGTGVITNIDWSITFSENMWIGGTANGTIRTISPGGKKMINSGLVFGYDLTKINVTASVKTASAIGFVFGPFVRIL